MQCPEKRASSWEEGLSSLPGGEWDGADSQREITQRMRRMTTRQTKKLKRKLMLIYKKVFSFSSKDLQGQLKTPYESSFA